MISLAFGATNAVDIGQRDVYALVGRDVDTGNASHVQFLLFRLPLYNGPVPVLPQPKLLALAKNSNIANHVQVAGKSAGFTQATRLSQLGILCNISRAEAPPVLNDRERH